tara:strand:+ start:420 stop:596 length:177 start_codon:yes stop_codon:yes gene_type:complete
MLNIKKMLEVIEDLQSPINREIKDDKQALEVWQLMNNLEEQLFEIKEQEEKKGGKNNE